MSDQSISAQSLKSFIDRIERLQSEKDAISEDMKEVFAQAKASGFDVKIMRKTIALRKLDPAERQEQEALIAVYENAIDGIVDTPLGKAAVSQARVVTATTVRDKRTTKSTRPSQPDVPADGASASGNAGKAQTDSGAESERTDQEPCPAIEGRHIEQTDRAGAEYAAPAMAASGDELNLPDFLRADPETHEERWARVM